MAMFSATVISGNSARSCQMTSMPAALAVAGDMVSIGLSGEGQLRARQGLVDAGNDLDQRALAAAIFAGDAVHFAGQNFEADILQRFDAAERHADVAKRQDRRSASSAARQRLIVKRASPDRDQAWQTAPGPT